MHTNTSFATNWASKGRIVVSIYHQNDKLQVQPTEEVDRKDISQVAKCVYDWRHRDLEIRASEFNDVYHQIDSKELLS